LVTIVNEEEPPLKRQFDAAQQQAFEALANQDFKALRVAIREQCRIIAAHREVIATLLPLAQPSRRRRKARTLEVT
jgi:hypothetical protein